MSKKFSGDGVTNLGVLFCSMFAREDLMGGFLVFGVPCDVFTASLFFSEPPYASAWQLLLWVGCDESWSWVAPLTAPLIWIHPKNHLHLYPFDTWLQRCWDTTVKAFCVVPRELTAASIKTHPHFSLWKTLHTEVQN